MPSQPQNLLRRVRELTDGGYKIHAIELKPGKSVLVLRDEEKVAKNEAHRKKMLAIETQKPKDNIDLTLFDECQQKLQETQQKLEETRRKLKVMAQELSDERKRASANTEETIATSRAKDQAQEAQKSSDLKALEAQRQLSIANKKLSAQKKSSDTENQQQTENLAEARTRIKTLENEQKEKDTAYKHQLAVVQGESLALEEDLRKSQTRIDRLCKERDSLKQSRNDLSKKAKAEKEELVAKIKERDDLVLLQQQSERTHKDTESTLREQLRIEQRTSAEEICRLRERQEHLEGLERLHMHLECQLMSVEDVCQEQQIGDQDPKDLPNRKEGCVIDPPKEGPKTTEKFRWGDDSLENEEALTVQEGQRVVCAYGSLCLSEKCIDEDGTGKHEHESGYTSNDVQAAWNHESHYASNEIQIVNDPRPARKKEEAARNSLLRHRQAQNLKSCMHGETFTRKIPGINYEV